MSMNFPLSPVVGQLFPSPVVPGMPQYTWDGSAWNSVSTPSVDTLALNGLQVNGGMDISQELGTAGRSTDGYVVDAWRVDHNGTMAHFTLPYATIAPGFSNHLVITITTAQTSITGPDYMLVGTSIEGYRIARLAWGTANAQPLTLAFWTCHHRTGTYTGVVRSGSPSPYRSCAFAYTQNAADIWEYKIVTVPGCIDGTWNITNGVGFIIYFAMACGTTYTAPATSVWYGINYLAGPGQINGVAATSDQFRLTGVTALPGSAAPTATNSPNIMRPYDQEFRLCSRYLQFNRVREPGFYQGALVLVITHQPLVQYRASPTASLTTTSVGYENLPWAAAYTLTGSVIDGSHLNYTGGDYKITGTGGGSGGSAGSPVSMNASVVKFDARL